MNKPTFCLKAGDIFADRYLIKQPLGKGGQGEVYEIVDLQTGNREVVKILTDIESTSNFKKEIAALKSIVHEGIIRIYDGDISGETPYYTMEYLDGLPLNEFIASYSLSKTEIEIILTKLLNALKHLHEVGGKLHMDIKPSNIYIVFKKEKDLDKEFADVSISRVVLLDFGTIRNIKITEETLTRNSSSIRGTYRYMAPEQLDAKECIPATDLYAVGEVLYEMLSKKPLFDSDTITGLLEQKKTPSMAFPEKGNAKMGQLLDTRWEKFISKAVEPDPKDRFQSAAEALNFLEKPPMFYLSSKKRRLFAFAALFLIMSFLGVFSFIRFVNNNEARSVKAMGNILYVYNKRGDVLWKKDFKAQIMNSEILENQSKSIKKEIIVTTGLSNIDDKESGGIYLFLENGEPVWSYNFGFKEWIKSCGQKFVSKFICADDLDGDEEKELVFSIYNEPFFANIILILKPNGKVYGEVWSCGAIYSIKLFEENGKKKMAVSACNNRLFSKTFFSFNVDNPFAYFTYGWKSSEQFVLGRSNLDLQIAHNTPNYVRWRHPETTILPSDCDITEKFSIKDINGRKVFAFQRKDGSFLIIGKGGLPAHEDGFPVYETAKSVYNLMNDLIPFIDFAQAERYKEACNSLMQFEKNVPEVPHILSWYYKTLGKVLQKSGDLKNARKNFEKALKIYPRDVAPWLFLTEIALLSDNLKEAENCLSNAQNEYNEYIAEYQGQRELYPLYLNIIKRDFESAKKTLNDLDSGKSPHPTYSLPANFQLALFAGQPPYKDISFYSDAEKGDPSHWFYRISNEFLIQDIPLNKTILAAPEDTMESTPYTRLVSLLDREEDFKNELKEIENKSKCSIEYRFYLPVCNAICAKYYREKGDKEKAIFYAKKTLASKPIGFIKDYAEKLIKK